MPSKESQPLLRCAFCFRPRLVSVRSHSENPFCNKCLDERLALARRRRGPLRVRRSGKHVYVSTEVTGKHARDGR